MRILLIPVAAALLASCAGTTGAGGPPTYTAKEQARLDKLLAGMTPGPAQRCIPLRDANGPESIGDTTLIFTVGRNLVYRTEVSGSCAKLGNGRTLITKTYSSELCRGDIATTADLVAGFQTGSCAMGDFVPYRREN